MSEPDSHSFDTYFQPPSLEELGALLPSYEMVDFLAQGGMGAVYLAKQISLDRLVAIKVLPPSWGEEKGYAQRFQTEARAMAKLRHNHIVGVYDFGITSAGHFYLVMEYVEGQTLHDMIRLRRLTPASTQAIALQLCEAIQSAHEHGILHRDLKPGNAMVDRHGQTKVMDFGLARRAEASVEEESLGTPEYTAPEIMEEGALIDHRADIYALGIVFQQMLTGHVPQRPREPLSTHGTFDPGWEPLIAKATATDPAHRFQSMRELREAVALVGKPIKRTVPRPGPNVPGQRPGPSGVRPSSPPQSGGGFPVFPLLISMALIAGGAYWWIQNRDRMGKADHGSPSAGTSSTAGVTPAPPPVSNGSTGAPPPVPVASVSGGYQLSEGPPGHVLKFAEGHKDKVHAVLLFPDQRRVATASADGTVGLWDLQTGGRLRTLGPVPGMVLKVALSPDGNHLGASGDNFKAYLWKLDDQLSEPTRSLDLKSRSANLIEFSPDGRTLLIGTTDTAQTFVAWEWPTGLDTVVPGFRSAVTGLVMRPGGDDDAFIVAGAHREGEKWVNELWRGHVGRRSLVKEYPAPPAAYRIRLSPGGKTVVGVANGRFNVWNLETGSIVSRQQGTPIGVYEADFLDGDRLIVCGGQDGTLNVFETVTGAQIWKSEAQATKCVNSIAVSADGKFVVSAGGYVPNNPVKDGDYALHIWRLPDFANVKSESADQATAKNDLLTLESSDPELWTLLGTLAQEWAQASGSNDGNARKDLDEKYLGALRREVASATANDREHWLGEISRVANNEPVPAQRPPGWPAALTRLHDIYVKQAALIPQRAQDAKAQLASAQKQKLKTLEQQRVDAKNAVGAARVRLIIDAVDALKGEMNVANVLRQAQGKPANPGGLPGPGAPSSPSPPAAPPAAGPQELRAPPMTGASVLRRPPRRGTVQVWKRSSRTDESSTLQWQDASPRIQEAAAVSAGFNHVLVLKGDGTVVALGKKSPTVMATVPAGLSNVVAVAAGNTFDLALREDGSVVVWSATEVHPTTGVRPAVTVHAGPGWGYARHADGLLTRLPKGDIGPATSFSEPPPGVGATADVAIGTHACIILQPDGTLGSWGSGGAGSEMAGLPADKSTTIVSVAANNTEAAALRRDGELLIWGANPGLTYSFAPRVFSGADRVVRALPSGAFLVHFPGDRWQVCNSNGQTVDAATTESLARGCFDLAVCAGYCVGIR